MNTATELNGLDKMYGRYDVELLEILSMDDGSWLLTEASLKELHGRFKDGQIFCQIFTGKIDGKLYVGDRNFISVWQDDECGNIEYQNSYYWDEIINTSIAEISAFLIHGVTYLSKDIVKFHDKIMLLLELNKATYNMHGSYGGCFENGECPKIEDLARYDIERMQFELASALTPILNSVPNGYEKTKRHQEYETFVNEREEQSKLDWAEREKVWENAPKRAIYDEETGELIAWERTDMD